MHTDDFRYYKLMRRVYTYTDIKNSTKSRFLASIKSSHIKSIRLSVRQRALGKVWRTERASERESISFSLARRVVSRHDTRDCFFRLTTGSRRVPTYDLLSFFLFLHDSRAPSSSSAQRARPKMGLFWPVLGHAHFETNFMPND